MRLGGNFYVLHAAGRLGNRQAISAQTFEMKRDGFLNLPSGLFDRIASRYTAGQVRHVSRVVAVAFLNNDGVSHVVLSRVRALRSYRRNRGTADMEETLSNEPLQPLIFSIRSHRVVLDSDLARLYGVNTKRFNEAFKRNRHRFPADFAFQLTIAEFNVMRSQIATGSQQEHDLPPEKMMWSQFATRSGRRRRSHRPWAFTEHGALMAANILRSERAVQMSVFVVRAFVRLREHVAANTAVLRRLAEIDKSLLRHDAVLRDVYQKLLPLLQPPADPPKRRIGFHPDD